MHAESLLEVITAWLATPLFSLGGKAVSGGGLLLALVFVVGIWWLAGLLERTLMRVSRGRGHEPGVQARVHMLSRLLRYSVWVIGTLVGLNYVGIVRLQPAPAHADAGNRP